MSATKEHLHDQIEAGQRGKQHKISWLNMPGYKPETWNPIVGCSKVSPGCDNCYAERMAIRLACMPNKSVSYDYKSVLFPDQNNKQTSWNGHTLFRQEQILTPLKWKIPRMVFICSMSDLFHEQTDFEKIDVIFRLMSDLDQHIYVILTKRPEVVLQFFCWKILRSGYNWRPKDNVWFGVTAENQEQANIRIPLLLKIPAAKRFVSIEPMLGPVDLTTMPTKDMFYTHFNSLTGCLENSITDKKQEAYNRQKGFEGYHRTHINWIICGGESGTKARPMHPDWVRSIRDQCQSAGTPFFFKQWGAYAEKMMFNDECRKVPVGIDGKQHHNWPKLETI